ncbi:MAG: hypothetical protein ACRC1P_02620 [Cellulosilyticaceae bacterium]
MIDQNKIILMSKVAVCEKRISRKDKEITTNYYPEDYIFIKNFKTRVIVLIIIGMMVAGQLLYKIEQGLNIPITIRGWIEEYILPYGILVVIVLTLYSILSTFVYKLEYRKAKNKVQRYEKAVEELKRYEEKIKGEEHDSK